jgi:hypothetical protein
MAAAACALRKLGPLAVVVYIISVTSSAERTNVPRIVWRASSSRARDPCPSSESSPAAAAFGAPFAGSSVLPPSQRRAVSWGASLLSAPPPAPLLLLRAVLLPVPCGWRVANAKGVSGRPPSIGRVQRAQQVRALARCQAPGPAT